MPNSPSQILDQVACELKLSAASVERTRQLLDDGNTVAFITRYRKDQTGGLDEDQIRTIERETGSLRQLAARKATILKSIEAQGKLTSELREEIDSASSLRRLEDLYLPFKAKKQTLATLARERGLAPLAEQILGGEFDPAELEARSAPFVDAGGSLATIADVKAGVAHLMAEQFSERADVRDRARQILGQTAELVVSKIATADAESDAIQPSSQPTADKAVPGQPAEESLSVCQRKRQKLERVLQDYFGFRERLDRVRPHRVLAINRGERGKVLRVKLGRDMEAIQAKGQSLLVSEDHSHRAFLLECARDAMQRLVVPSLEREIRRELTEHAEAHAVGVFARNLRKLLLQPPVHGRRVLAIDPGFKSGCQLAALDAFGTVLGHNTIHLVGGEENVQSARTQLAELVTVHELSAIAIGNGSGCRETEEVVADVIAYELAGRGVEYAIVNGAGASVYSASTLGREELSEYDAIYRGAVSIGRRLIDPLSELVKINPANIGVGMYQHDVKAKHLRESLDAVVESCVNYVGVDVNAASPALLSYVSGLNQLTARRLYEYRQEHGPFRSREQLKDVPGIGEATFVQSAGFLRIVGGDESLDATWIHPESYSVATKLLGRFGCTLADFAEALASKGELDLAALAQELDVGELLLKDILSALRRPGRDPREDLPAPAFRSGIMKLDDVEPGMELSGTVINVVDFGAFVDIGLSDSALIHISHLADRFIRDPHDVVSIGDVLSVWVLSVDKERRRVALTAIAPGSQSRTNPPERQETAEPKPARKPSRPRQTKRSSGQRAESRPRPPKFRKRPTTPAKPITQQMVEGAEPMRSFSDLVQYYEVKEKDTPEEGEA
ncbi:MAG: RNA-binding transcriptional accessory protein [Planctomycetaceae bacterium]|nr:RNA-binding transcriptional accessory protein [Planctomycetaceae bacterium]